MNSFSDNEKLKIIQFVKQYFEEIGEVPTIRTLTTKLSVNPKELYKVFPGGLHEICAEAGCPVPQQRIDRTRAAVEGRAKQRPEGSDTADEPRKRPLSQEYEVFRKQRTLLRLCEQLLERLNKVSFEAPLTDQGQMLQDSVSFLRERANTEDPEDLDTLADLLKGEVQTIDHLSAKNTRLREERLKAWVLRRRMDQLSIHEDEAKQLIEGEIPLFKAGINGLYEQERREEKMEHIRSQCTKYMSSDDFNRLGLAIPYPSSSSDLLTLWRQERKIIAKYGNDIVSELEYCYTKISDSDNTLDTHGLLYVFEEHLKHVGLSPCPRCSVIIDLAKVPRRFRCYRCGKVLIKRH